MLKVIGGIICYWTSCASQVINTAIRIGIAEEEWLRWKRNHLLTTIQLAGGMPPAIRSHQRPRYPERPPTIIPAKAPLILKVVTSLQKTYMNRNGKNSRPEHEG